MPGLAKIEQFAGEHGMYLERRAEVPAQFVRRKEVRIDRHLYQQVVEYVSESQGHG